MVKPSAHLDGFDFPEKTLSRAPEDDPYKEWFRAIKGGADAEANFAAGGTVYGDGVAGGIGAAIEEDL